jgi:hypothetical protein
MVFRQVYTRPLDVKPACRRQLFPQSLRDVGHQRLPQGFCLCHVCPWLEVALWRCDHCDISWTKKAKVVQVCPLPTKATRESLNGSSGSDVKRSAMFDSFPEIWQFLTCLTAPDGSTRQPGTVSLSLNGGIWNLALNDPATGLYAALSCQTIDDLILMVEARLSEGTMPWKVSKYPPRKGK